VTSRPRRHRATAGPTQDDYRGSPSDEALLEGMAMGDEECTVAFVRRYQRRVYGLAVGIVHDRGVAEDVAQEVMLRAWRHAPMFDPRRGSVENWTLTIARNLSIDALRRQRSIPTDPDALVAMSRASSGPSIEDVVSIKSHRAAILHALEQLSSEQGRAVILAALYGRTALEISEIEGIPLGTAKTRIRTGLRRLHAVIDVNVEDRT